MSNYLLARPNGESSSTVDGLRSIAMNVLGQAGYGQPQRWTSTKATVSDGTKLTYFDIVSRIIIMLTPAAMIPTWFLALNIMPKISRELSEAIYEYPKQTHALIDKEKIHSNESGEERSNFIAMLARLSDGNGGDSKGSGLSPEEIQGNLFLVGYFLTNRK